jgi:protein-L-isoaspartate(D-aspartate) O-methyltransferase
MPVRPVGRNVRSALLAGLALTASCVDPEPTMPPIDSEHYAAQRRQMVERQLQARDITDARVLAAMLAVPREAFVPREEQPDAYADQALPIGRGQTISQPYVVALMTQLLGLRGGERVLEIGTGSGYQAAVLGHLAGEVYSIEIDEVLAERARSALGEQGYRQVHVRAGDGFFGWPDAAPFDAIIITAATPRLPDTLRDQLREGGRVVVPLEQRDGEELRLGIKRGGEIEWQDFGGVRFVPMTGEVRRTP